MKKLFLLLISILIVNTLNAQPKFSGLAYGDYFYNAAVSDSTKANLNGFQFRRIYLTADYTISESFDSRFRFESDQTVNSNTPGGKLGVMVKDAWLKWKNVFSGSDLIFGISPTPAFDISEAAWGYRSLEKTIMDLRSIVPSRDFGIDLKGKLTGDGMIKYWLKAANNSGNAPETDKYKRYYALVQISPTNNFMFTVYGDYQALAQKLDTFDKKNKDNNVFTGSLFLNYAEKDQYSFGVEGFYKTQSNNIDLNIPTATAASAQVGYGLSFWGWYGFSDIVRLVARYDMFEPNKDYKNNTSNLNYTKGDQLGFILAGLDFKVDKNVSIIPNFEYTTYQYLPKLNSTYDHDLVARVTFAYNF
jgi:hypothetical protein